MIKAVESLLYQLGTVEKDLEELDVWRKHGQRLVNYLRNLEAPFGYAQTKLGTAVSLCQELTKALEKPSENFSADPPRGYKGDKWVAEAANRILTDGQWVRNRFTGYIRRRDWMPLHDPGEWEPWVPKLEECVIVRLTHKKFLVDKIWLAKDGIRVEGFDFTGCHCDCPLENIDPSITSP